MKASPWFAGLMIFGMIFAICNPHNYPCSQPYSEDPRLPGIKGACPAYPPEGLFDTKDYDPVTAF